MKKLLPIIITLLLTFAACGGDDAAVTTTPAPDIKDITIVGTWVQDVEVSVLGEGVEAPGVVDAAMTIVLHEDGTGVWTTVIPDHPAIERVLTYVDEGGTLAFTFDDGGMEEYTYTLTDHILSLERRQVKLDFVRGE